MSPRLLILATILLGLTTPALAHRLDEYLQAATIALARDQVTVTLRLTPGIAVAPEVLAAIDTNGDDTLSPAEQQAYAAQIRQDLRLTIDGQTAPLRLTASAFPPSDALRHGLGEIALTFAAALPPTGAPHDLTFENHQGGADAIYLANTLLPCDPAIHVLGQQRTFNQSTYRLTFTLDAPKARRLPQRQDAQPVLQTFFWHGVHHILTGYDHLLFIGALVLGATTLWDLVKVVTAFTLAHTITLAALNLVHLPDTIVEPLIAASIVCVAAQNILAPDQARGWSRLAIAFVFGLFHGLGFAGGLLDLMHPMPKGTILLAILGFSLGVEAGNQLVLLPLFALLKTVRHTRPARSLQRLGSAAISLAGLYYLCLALP